MAAGLQVIELTVQHVREPCQRVPIEGVVGGDCPGGPRGGQARADRQVLIDIIVVVVVDKAVVDRLPENDNDGQYQKAADSEQSEGRSQAWQRVRNGAIHRCRSRRLRAFRAAGLRRSVFFAFSTH